MALRMTEEEFADFQRRHSFVSVHQAVATWCQMARASGVSVADMESRVAENMSTIKEQMNAPKRQKYGNQRVEVDGIKFDSKHEAVVYQELMLRVCAGELKTVCRQVKFDLPGGIAYIADFVAIRPDFSIEGVYDAKSEATKGNRVYINKKKQMKACLGIEIQEV